ncbi:MAG: hypothetical protein KC469_12740 [Flavobacteriaceae bacterium]|jgi:hypothetical protein|nr:hypothetical protein [Flavobacteriaceae bacterium]
MKRILPIIVLFVTLNAIGQSKDRMEKLKTLKIAFITEKLNLSQQEAQAFWPIYNAYDNASNELRRNQRNEFRKNVKRGEKVESLDDGVSKKLVATYISTEEKQVQLKKQIVADLEPVLSSKKIWRLILAEDEFKQKMIEEFKKRRAERKKDKKP